MVSSYSRAALLKQQSRKSKKKKTTIAGKQNATYRTPSRMPPPRRPLGALRSLKNTITRQKPSSSDNTSFVHSRQQQQQQQQRGGTNHFTIGHSNHYQQGLLVANSQPSTVSFRSSVASQASVGVDVPMSQLTCSQFSNESSASQNSIVPELHQHSASSSSSHNTSGRSTSNYMEGSNVAPSLYSMVVGQHNGGGGSVQQSLPANTPRRRPWMGSVASGVLSMSYRSKARVEHSSESSEKRLPLSRAELENDMPSTGAGNVLDHPVKEGEEETSIDQDTTKTNEKPNSLITDHFKVVPINVKSEDKGPQQETLLAEHEKRLEQKRLDLEKLFAAKQQGLEALASDIETKICDFDKRLEEETTSALARLNAAASDGVDTIHRGMESFSKLVADAKDSFQSMAKKLLSSSDTQRGNSVTSSQESEKSMEESGEESSIPSQVSSVPSTVRITSTRTKERVATGKRKNAPKAESSSDKREEPKAAPTTRTSKRLKAKTTPAAMSPKRATSPARNSKAYCVTPSTKSASRAVQPVSIAVTRRTSTKKRLASTTTADDSTLAKTRSSSHVTTNQAPRGKKKANRASTASKPSPETVSDSQSSDESSTFVGPELNAMGKRRKQAKGVCRVYGARNQRIRHVNTSLDDCFDFMSSQESY